MNRRRDLERRLSDLEDDVESDGPPIVLAVPRRAILPERREQLPEGETAFIRLGDPPGKFYQEVPDA